MYPPARPRVFLCDDNQGLRATIRELLTDAGIEVVGEAVDGIDALRRVPPAAYEAPLVVFMDLRMPGPINGIEATRLLVDRCVDARVVLFTAFPGERIEQAARAAGAVGFLVKGAPANAIIAEIGRVWSGAPVGSWSSRRVTTESVDSCCRHDPVRPQCCWNAPARSHRAIRSSHVPFHDP
jgi:DNA-binding NarL/FixJ family response regulator